MRLHHLKTIAVSCMLGFATIVMPVAPPAQAMPMVTGELKVERSGDVQTVRHHGRRYWRHGGGYYGARRWHRRHYARPGFGIYIGPRRVYRDRYIRRGGGHVNWCLARYRSYNPATNRFLSYGGVYKVCHSPYR